MLSMLASSAGAATWTQVSTASPTNLDQVGVVRTPDWTADLPWPDEPSWSGPLETSMDLAFDQGRVIRSRVPPFPRRRTGWIGLGESVDVVDVPAGDELPGRDLERWSHSPTPAKELHGELVGSVGSVDGKTWAPARWRSSAALGRLRRLGDRRRHADPRAGQSVVVGASGFSAPREQRLQLRPGLLLSSSLQSRKRHRRSRKGRD